MPEVSLDISKTFHIICYYRPLPFNTEPPCSILNFHRHPCLWIAGLQKKSLRTISIKLQVHLIMYTPLLSSIKIPTWKVLETANRLSGVRSYIRSNRPVSYIVRMSPNITHYFSLTTALSITTFCAFLTSIAFAIVFLSNLSVNVDT